MDESPIIETITDKLITFGEWAMRTDYLVTQHEGPIKAKELAEEIYTLIEETLV